MGAQGCVEWNLSEPQAEFRFDPLAAIIDKSNRREGRAANGGDESGEIVKGRLCRRVENAVLVKTA